MLMTKKMILFVTFLFGQSVCFFDELKTDALTAGGVDNKALPTKIAIETPASDIDKIENFLTENIKNIDVMEKIFLHDVVFSEDVEGFRIERFMSDKLDNCLPEKESRAFFEAMPNDTLRQNIEKDYEKTSDDLIQNFFTTATYEKLQKSVKKFIALFLPYCVDFDSEMSAIDFDLLLPHLDENKKQFKWECLVDKEQAAGVKAFFEKRIKFYESTNDDFSIVLRFEYRHPFDTIEQRTLGLKSSNMSAYTMLNGKTLPQPYPLANFLTTDISIAHGHQCTCYVEFIQNKDGGIASCGCSFMMRDKEKFTFNHDNLRNYLKDFVSSDVLDDIDIIFEDVPGRFDVSVYSGVIN